MNLLLHHQYLKLYYIVMRRQPETTHSPMASDRATKLFNKFIKRWLITFGGGHIMIVVRQCLNYFLKQGEINI